MSKEKWPKRQPNGDWIFEHGSVFRDRKLTIDEELEAYSRMTPKVMPRVEPRPPKAKS
ncbi:MAG: hypothetical protein ACI82A_001608 [Candidatus Azotimanducaceae bacterium]|jgi:hypothetical protein